MFQRLGLRIEKIVKYSLDLQYPIIVTVYIYIYRLSIEVYICVYMLVCA